MSGPIRGEVLTDAITVTEERSVALPRGSTFCGSRLCLAGLVEHGRRFPHRDEAGLLAAQSLLRSRGLPTRPPLVDP